MTYLVMECHPGYAVVLDQKGHFLKVANLNYQVGQTLSSVIELHAEPEQTSRKLPGKYHYFFRYAASAAACLLLAAIGSWHFILTPYGSVRMQINPDVKMNVNRLNYVISAKSLNLDGEAVMEGYQFKGQKLFKAADELAQRAMDMGYLKEGGEIRIFVESTHENWKANTEEALLLELENHTNHTITITAAELEHASSSPDITEAVIKATTPSSTAESAEDNWDEDDELDDNVLDDDDRNDDDRDDDDRGDNDRDDDDLDDNDRDDDDLDDNDRDDDDMGDDDMDDDDINDELNDENDDSDDNRRDDDNHRDDDDENDWDNNDSDDENEDDEND